MSREADTNKGLVRCNVMDELGGVADAIARGREDVGGAGGIGECVEPVEVRDQVKPRWRSWAPERMLGDDGREMASSGIEVVGVPEMGERWEREGVLKARTACWAAT